MMIIVIAYFCIISIAFALVDETLSLATPQRFAFGSCAGGLQLPQPLWPDISAMNPQLWIWLGDAIYADMYLNGTRIPNPEMSMRDKFNVQKFNVSGYADFLTNPSLLRALGTWDDHDFGNNDGGKYVEFKDDAKRYFLEFLDEPENSVRYARAGVYASYDFGSELKRNLVRIILLDVRYFRDDIEPLDMSRSMLGEEQWKWLEEQFRDSPARVHLIGTGVQFISDGKSLLSQGVTKGRIWGESWGNFPADRQRLINLIGKYRAPGVIFLSGDVHMAELYKLQCSNVGYPLYDITSSSLSHSWTTNLENLAMISQQREAPYHGSTKFKTFNILDNLFARGVFNLIFNFLIPHDHRIRPAFGGLNYGIVEFDWKADLLKLQIFGPNGLVFEEPVEISSLTYSEAYLFGECNGKERAHAALRYDELSNWSWIWKFLLIVVTVWQSVFCSVYWICCTGCCGLCRGRKQSIEKQKVE
jgi:alkaline phosphatase D